MNDKCASPQQNSPSTASAKGDWKSPTIEELDFTSTEAAFNASGTDGPYTS
ncbi:MAG TPA: hypothetical protein VF548_14695 [Allosphingosinicella sp.]